MMKKVVFAALMVLALAGSCFAAIQQGESGGWSFLSIWFNDYSNIMESGAYLHWTYDFGDSIHAVNAGSCSNVEYSTGYVIIPYDWYQSHKSTVDAGIQDVGSIYGHPGYYAHGNAITALIRDRILGGSWSYDPKELKPWGPGPSSCTSVMNIKAEGSGLDRYLVIGVGCIYNYELWHGERSFCEVATSETVIYDCDVCGSDVCLLDYLNHNNAWIDGFFNRFGGNGICIREGGLDGFCTSTGDCKNIVSKPDPFTWWADHDTPYYALTAVHCEKDNPTDPRISYINQFSSVGEAGTCVYGAKAGYDCETVYGSVNGFPVRTKDGGYNSQRSGWGVKDGQCILGECNGFGACYDLYNSIYYECVPVDKSAASSYAVCKQTEWTTAQIQAKCEEVEGKPKSGYAWYVDKDGRCYQDRPAESECNTAKDCKCSGSEIAVCQKITTNYGTIGVCSCRESGGPVSPSQCGDHVCDAANGENSETCPEDCGHPATTRPPGVIIEDEDNSGAVVVGILVVALVVVGAAGIMLFIKK